MYMIYRVIIENGLWKEKQTEQGQVEVETMVRLVLLLKEEMMTTHQEPIMTILPYLDILEHQDLHYI